MGIRLDWEIESESKQVKSTGEDPQSARKRRAARLRFVLMVLGFLLIVASVIGAFAWRWHQINANLEQSLRDTVAAEVTALRLGDEIAFNRFQRSATADWSNAQSQLFDEYQRLLIRDDLNIQLTGHVLSVEIDDPRARVHVQEIIGGVPYTRVWFYWRYEDDADRDDFVDGWRHVPPDLKFWGNQKRLATDNLVINYREVDAVLAQQMNTQLNRWLADFCNVFSCENFPTISVDIVSEGVQEISWDGADVWRLRVLSPYLDRARTDSPFSHDMQLEVASLLAERLVIFAADGVEANHLTDAYFLQQSVASWLVGQFIQMNTNSHLIASFAENYDISALLAAIAPQSTMDVLAQVTGTPLDQLLVDWRDFFEWRLRLENALIVSGNTDAFLSLYDTHDDGVRTAAYSRVNQILPDPIVVTLTRPHTVSAGGLPQRAVTVVAGEDRSIEMEILFRLVDGHWLRAS